MRIDDLDALQIACKALGLEFRKDQKQFKWYGRHVGDYPVPEGFTKEDMGKCDHAIAIPNNSSAYQVGVCKARDKKGGWTLLWDFWSGGKGLQAKIGDGGARLLEEYAATRAERVLRSQGYIVQRKTEQKVGV